MTRRAVRTGAWILLFAALGAAAAAWFTPTPELDAADAAQVAQGALAAADVESELSGAPRAGEHRTEDGDEIPVWIVLAETEVGRRTEEIELRVQRSAGRVVYVDDRIGPDDAERLLSDDEFRALGRHRDDSTTDRWVLRNGLAGVSGLVVAAACFLLATRADRLWEER
jgi:hypothetical protein